LSGKKAIKRDKKNDVSKNDSMDDFLVSKSKTSKNIKKILS
jgi:hypothetical protein